MNYNDIKFITADEIHNSLGFREKLRYSKASVSKSLADWKMEEDDAPIFRYIYRNFKPERHLEFGTWKGAGVMHCLEECEATVWTINLLEGEINRDGSWEYYESVSSEKNSSLLKRLLTKEERDSCCVPPWSKKKKIGQNLYSCQTDSFGFIGYEYLQRGYGHRVCQIYCDSLEWDISKYPAGFFDSALIDGGHSEGVVMNDTKKACSLVRPGGLIMWHDFCPIAEVRKKCSSVDGVVSAVEKNISWILSRTRELFWIEPSWILVGIRK